MVADLVSALACVATVWSFALFLIFERELRQRLQALALREARLMRARASLQRLESWVPANSAWSHAPFCLVCVSRSHYRVAARQLRQRDLRVYQSLFRQAARAESLHVEYYWCFDLWGVFGEVGSCGPLHHLSAEGCRLLKLSPLMLWPAAPLEEVVSEPEPAPPVTPSWLPPLFASRRSDPVDRLA